MRPTGFVELMNRVQALEQEVLALRRRVEMLEGRPAGHGLDRLPPVGGLDTVRAVYRRHLAGDDPRGFLAQIAAVLGPAPSLFGAPVDESP